MSAFNGLRKFEFTYILNQDNHGKNVSVQWFVKKRIYVHPKPGQRRQKRRHSMVCEKSNSRTLLARTTTVRMSAFNGLWKFEYTYSLSQDNHGRMSAFNGLWEIEFTYSLSQDNHGRMLAFNGLWKIEFTYFLSQDNDGENVSVQWLVKNRIHVLPKSEQPRGECQHSMACEKSNSRTL